MKISNRMVESLHQRLEGLKQKARLLTTRYRDLQQEKRAADERIADLQRELATRQQEISRLQQQIEHLTVVGPLSTTREDAEQSKTVLSDLVREIDKCINELNQ